MQKVGDFIVNIAMLYCPLPSKNLQLTIPDIDEEIFDSKDELYYF